MALARTLLAVALVALATGCALTDDSANQEAGAAVKTVLEMEYFGNYAGAWDRLHPRHQRLVTRKEYEDCRSGIDVKGTIESVLILDVQDAPLTVYGLPPRTPAKRVKVRVVTDESEYTATYHIVLVGTEWRWVLSDKAARGFKRTACPA
jgi:predicted nucleotidyltransferase